MHMDGKVSLQKSMKIGFNHRCLKYKPSFEVKQKLIHVFSCGYLTLRIQPFLAKLLVFSI